MIHNEINIINFRVNNRKRTDDNYKFKSCTVIKVAKGFELVIATLN